MTIILAGIAGFLNNIISLVITTIAISMSQPPDSHPTVRVMRLYKPGLYSSITH